MAMISCFCALLGGKRKKSKDTKKVSYAKRANGIDCPKVKPVEFMDTADIAYVSKGSNNAPARDTKDVADTAAGAELACQGRGEIDDKASIQRAVSNADLAGGRDASGHSSDGSDGADKDTISAAPEDVSVSGVGRAAPTAAPSLERSCSNIETARSGWKAFDLLPVKSRSHDDLVNLPAGSMDGAPDASPTASVKTTSSADRVMLKRRSSSQVLPSRSRKLWWRLFLWSHRNLHRPGATTPTSPPADAHAVPHHHQHDGYTSDTLDTGTAAAAADSKNKEIAAEMEEPFPNQWVAFSAEASSLDRVSAWVMSSLADGSFIHAEEDGITEHDADGSGVIRPHCLPEVGESSTTSGARAHAQHRRRPAADDAVQAGSIVQTLNAFSSVAHISGMGLKVVPMISAFSTLRAVNLSGNFIAHISPGSLPKGLHSLDLSRNSIATIEGLRELTRLRVLNLSYNRISRIGHGLSNCTSIRELYLAGNKISDVEGLHRLLKLAVLDLSFNKITTVKGLGQLVANYNSLRALNLLGNPVQTNVGDDTLRKAVSGFLPRLEYLNKQPVKPQRAGEVAKDSVAKAALGNSGWSSRRRVSSRRLSQSPGSSAKGRGRDVSSSHRGSRSRSKNRLQSSSFTRR